ncbi:MAG: transcriptional regulator Spx [Erysipelotrichales bacterium]|nr:transcriptional regulator Spx [Erysipelotrichales bacterium]
MIKIYTSPSCSSCRKVKKWFESQKIDYIERSIFSPSFNEKDIYEILEKSENGTEDIISTKSKIIKENKIDLDKLSTSQLIKFILDNPTVLKRPIIVDDSKIQIGYNSEEIRVFIPEEVRRLARLACARDLCKKYDDCEHKKDYE